MPTMPHHLACLTVGMADEVSVLWDQKHLQLGLQACIYAGSSTKAQLHPVVRGEMGLQSRLTSFHSGSVCLPTVSSCQPVLTIHI